jgi:predicted transcriptional regulator
VPEKKSNRGKIEIMADILSLSTAGIKKTHIMYRANLSYEQILYYLNELMAKSLISLHVRDGSALYTTTEKGREFLKCYAYMAQLIGDGQAPSQGVELLVS